jgi:hypothetical protein
MAGGRGKVTLGVHLTRTVPEAKKATLIPAGWFDMWADATFATDPAGGGQTLRAPNGVVQDGLDYCSSSWRSRRRLQP